MSLTIYLGLPHLRQGAILRRAIACKYPVLVSANAFSRWRDIDGVRSWSGWSTNSLENLPAGTNCILDSGGFTAHSTYSGFCWTIDQYLDLAKLPTFSLFAALDYPAEQELAARRENVEERVSRTIGANRTTYRHAIERGIAHRLMPVLQGRTAADYLACARELAPILDTSGTIGIGSMCRRHVNGPNGILEIVSHLDQHLPSHLAIHLFGVKGSALAAIGSIAHREISIDSQAYGVAARQAARKSGITKSDSIVADAMTRWLARQRQHLSRPVAMPRPSHLEQPRAAPCRPTNWSCAIDLARAHFNKMIASCDLDHDEITEAWVLEHAADLLHTYDLDTAQ